MNKVSVSIVLYRTNPQVLRDLLESLKDSSLPVDIVAIDNSEKPDLQELCESFSSVDYRFLGKNLGYGGAHNIALRSALETQKKYHVVLNPDIRFEKDTLQKLFEYMETDSSVGWVMPKILYPDGKIQFLCKLLPTPMDLIVRRFCPVPSWLEKWNERYELRFADYSKSMDVPCLSGCFMFLRVSALPKVGLFDESYFMYLEDFDLCRRMGEHYRTVYFPDAVAFHDYGKGSYLKWKLFKYHLASAIHYFSKTGWFFDPTRTDKNRNAVDKIREDQYRAVEIS